MSVETNEAAGVDKGGHVHPCPTGTGDDHQIGSGKTAGHSQKESIACESPSCPPRAGVDMSTFVHPKRTPQPTFPNLPLGDWLGLVRGRGYSLRVEDGLPCLAPSRDGGECHPVWRDYVMLRRHTHALLVATTRSHPEWWAFASGQSEVPPSVAQVPVALDDPDAFACAACGHAADRINDRAIPWCAEHHPDSGWPS